MRTFRQIIFWAHLVAGLLAGLAIAVMCFTGTVLAFEKEMVAWSERAARRVEPPAPDAAPLPLDELQRRFRAAQPEARPTSIVVQNDPQAAVVFSAGRTGGFYVNPYTGETTQPESDTAARFMQTMTAWHRTLGFTGEESRPRGKWINGASNIAFCVLAVTGLYLWIPRRWSWRGVKAVAVFNGRLTGKARDFNWHNAIGLWTAPVLIVLTLTAIPISFQWGGRVIAALAGTPPTESNAGGARGGPGGFGAGPVVEVPAPGPGAARLSQEALLRAAQQHAPEWQTITIRTGAGGPGGRGGQGERGVRPGEGRGPGREPRPANAEGGANARVAENSADGGAPVRAIVPAATLAIRERGSWPRTATLTLALDPYTGAVLRRSGYADLPAAQRVRSWTRFLHTGEALGWPGQLAAGLACVGGCVLVWTGFALAWRRFFGRHAPAA